MAPVRRADAWGFCTASRTASKPCSICILGYVIICCRDCCCPKRPLHTCLRVLHCGLRANGSKKGPSNASSTSKHDHRHLLCPGPAQIMNASKTLTNRFHLSVYQVSVSAITLPPPKSSHYKRPVRQAISYQRSTLVSLSPGQT